MIVSSMSLCTEVLPAYRATMMSAFFAMAGLGRVLGALIGGAIWLSGGIQATCLVSAGVTLLAFGSLAVGLKRL
jgi:DHA1 family inner membrane transport protein